MKDNSLHTFLEGARRIAYETVLLGRKNVILCGSSIVRGGEDGDTTVRESSEEDPSTVNEIFIDKLCIAELDMKRLNANDLDWPGANRNGGFSTMLRMKASSKIN